MSSIIPGYTYDIFISYRQKDNKYDGWVTEFVDNLKKELEATFKEEISVYFDLNPHDGLLETHDVDASLKSRLKCLIFIPVISRTYCDPKSFAWEHEFKAFVEQASNDQYGLKVKLMNGNVVNRVLPVRIYDLDGVDLKLCENVLGGFLRGVEFIYKEPGVNRPLRSNEERPHDNLNHTIYRNQINKVANAIKDIILGLKPDGESSENRLIDNVAKQRLDPGIDKRKRNLREFPTIIRPGIVIPWITAIILAVVLISFLLNEFLTSSKLQTVISFQQHLTAGETIGRQKQGSSVVISPDGNSLIYVASRNDSTFLKYRRIDELEVKTLPGTEGADAPFFSPDSKWIAFFANGNLKKMSIQGGAPQVICDARTLAGGCWGEDNNIIYADSYKACLMRVPAEGGTPEQITSALKFSVGETEHSHFWPQILPGGEIILFTIWRNSEDMQIIAVSLETGKRWNIINPGAHAIYVKTGYLVYGWKGDILAVPFNLRKMKVTGQPSIVIKGVIMNNIGLAHFSISNNGSLVFIPGELSVPEKILSNVNFNGENETTDIQAYQSPQFSPDGKQVLFVRDGLWLYNLDRGTLRRFADRKYNTYWAIWSPDGSKVVFNSSLQGGSAVNLFQQMADGTGSVEKVVTGSYHQQPKCWVNGDSLLIYTEGINPETGMDIFMISTVGDTIPKPLLNSRFNEIHPDISSDGRWLAYVSDESGQDQVFICSFPDLANKVQISTAGGYEPVWAPDGSELYYRDITGDKLMAVSFLQGKEIQIGKPRLLFQGNYFEKSGPWGRNYDISPDGKRFLMIKEREMTPPSTHVNIIFNWSERLKKDVQ